MLTVISYDIVDDRRRSKVAKTLLDYGTKVQYSVFELDDPEKIGEIEEKLSAVMNIKEDSIRCYQLCQGCEKRKKIMGKDKAPYLGEQEYIII